MHIILLGHRDIASLLALDCLVRRLPGHRFTALYSDGAFPSDSGPVKALDALAEADQALVDRWRQGDLSFKPVTELSLHAASLLNTPNKAGGLATLESLEPDLIISIRYRRILRDAAIAIPRLGVINIHSGLLPDYRGVMATFWAMLNDEPSIGAAIHGIVDSGIDTGPLYASVQRPNDPTLSYLGNVLSLYPDACERVRGIVELLAQGDVPATSAQSPGGNYYSMPMQDDVDRFLDRGLQLTDGREDVLIERLYADRAT